MGPKSSLDKWRFLVGEWKGKAEEQFGEKGVTESVAVFTMEPSERFIMGKHEAWNEGRQLTRA